MQSYTEIPGTQTISSSRTAILDNDKTIMSNSSGTTAPSVNLQTGMSFYNTTKNQIYTYNGSTWDVLAAGKLYDDVLDDGTKYLPSQFLRSDADDTGSSILTLSNATPLKLQAGAGRIEIDDSAKKRLSWDDGGSSLALRSNSYYSAGEKYVVSGDGAASVMCTTEGANGSINLKVGPTGTADNTISYSQTLTLDHTNGIEFNGTQVSVLNNSKINVNSIFQLEKSNADVDVAGRGQWWTLNSAPNLPMFTDDTGVDHRFIGKQTIWMPATSIISRTSQGAIANVIETTTNKNMVSTLDFDEVTQNYAQFRIAFPKSWDVGFITFIPYWSHPTTTTNFGVVWELQAVAVSNDDALDVAFGAVQQSIDTGGTTDDLYIGPESSNIVIGGTPVAGDEVMFQITRNTGDASDTLAVDARLHGIKIIYNNKSPTDD